MMGSFMGRGNQYIQLVKVLYCKLPTISKQLQSSNKNGLNRFMIFSKKKTLDKTPNQCPSHRNIISYKFPKICQASCVIKIAKF